MDRDPVPLQYIPLRVWKKLGVYLESGTEHTWQNLAECMELDALTVSVGCFVLHCFVVFGLICYLPLLLQLGLVLMTSHSSTKLQCYIYVESV